MIRKFIEDKSSLCAQGLDKYDVGDDINLLGDLKKPGFHLLKDIDNTLDEIFPKNDFTLTEISSILEIDEETIRERHLKLKDGSYFEPPSSGLKIKNRVRHVLTEAERVERSKECIRELRMDEFGQLMYQSHKSCAEDYEVSCPELDRLVEIAGENGAIGARLTGAGFGGCTANLVHKQKADGFKKGMVHGYYKNYSKKEQNFSDYIFACHPSNGAQKVM
jgi:galactokinase